MKALVEIPSLTSWHQGIICKDHKHECSKCPLGRMYAHGYECLWKKKSKGKVQLDVYLKNNKETK